MAHILIIDDDTATASMLQVYLEHTGYLVSHAADGESGLRKLEGETYDLVLLDWRMPGRDGIEVLKAFRLQNQITPVIMLTGQGSINEKELGLDCGANDYITKPFHVKEVGARIRAMLKRQELIKTPPVPLGSDNKALLDAANLVGTSLAAKYEFIEVLGQGGFGLIFKARHPYLQKTVAIKMVQAQILTDEVINRFHLEARAASRLNHRNIVVVHDFGVTENQQPYMVMELVEGENLDCLLEKVLSLPFDVAKPLFIGICDAMEHAHEMGVFHRDLKPGNFVTRRDKGDVLTAKIVDFGLAQFASHRARSDTTKGYVGGSPLYTPPEIFKGYQSDHRVDIYALGCTLFEVLTGSTPINGQTLGELIYNHERSNPMRLSQTRPDLTFPPGLQELIDTCLRKSPQDRFQSMSAMTEALRQIG